MKLRFHMPAIVMILFLLVFTISNERNIVFFGDSLTAGYGINENQAFPALIQQMINDRGKNYNVINAGLSGETSAGGLRRVDWLLRNPVDVFVLGLGANDGLRGMDLNVTRQNLQQIVDKVRESNPDIKLVIAGMQIPPNLGADYANDFKEIYIELADNNDAILIPFLLEGVAGDPHLNQADGIHPNTEGHKIMAETVWEILREVL